MSRAWDELGGSRETFAAALARSNAALRPNAAPLTEQELAAREIAARERMKLHDRVFADNYLTGPEQQLVSRSLARQFGSYFGDGSDTPGDDE